MNITLDEQIRLWSAQYGQVIIEDTGKTIKIWTPNRETLLYIKIFT